MTASTPVGGPAAAAPPSQVVLHPLVLLSIVDHYNRVARDTKKRVVGVLLGDVHKGTVDVSNSFACEFSPGCNTQACAGARTAPHAACMHPCSHPCMHARKASGRRAVPQQHARARMRPCTRARTHEARARTPTNARSAVRGGRP